MKFNMGCGHNRLAGFVNVDASPTCEPDEVWDLDETPWPWPDGCAEEVRFIHSLEHMGADPKTFLAIMSELYRICAPEAAVRIHVPHPRHENFISDPTHVRAITPDTIRLFDRALNLQWQAQRGANSTLALRLGVDFHLEEEQLVIDEPFAGQRQREELSDAALRRMLLLNYNVAREYRFLLRVRKG